MKIPIQAPPDFSSIVPPDVAAGGQAPPPTSDGVSIDNMGPEQANSIPDSGVAKVGFKKTHHRIEKNIHPDGSTTEKHHVRLSLHHFEPQADEKMDEESPKKGKKLVRDAGQAVAEHFGE